MVEALHCWLHLHPGVSGDSGYFVIILTNRRRSVSFPAATSIDLGGKMLRGQRHAVVGLKNAPRSRIHRPLRVVEAIALFAALLAILTPGRASAQESPVVPFPGNTTSYYETSVSASFAYAQGQNAASTNTVPCNPTSPPLEVVVLDFGQPDYNATTNTYGLVLFDSGQTVATVASLRTFLLNWEEGWTSKLPLGCTPNLQLAISTNNYNYNAAHGTSCTDTTCEPCAGDTSACNLYQFGAALGAIANLAWADAINHHIATVMPDLGGDFEPSYSPFTWAQDIMNGAASQDETYTLSGPLYTYEYYFFDFGSGESGQPIGDPWTVVNLAYFGGGVWAPPGVDCTSTNTECLQSLLILEIYNSGTISDWINVLDQSYWKPYFDGDITQGGYGGTYLPSTAWTNFNNALAADLNGPNQTPSLATDI